MKEDVLPFDRDALVYFFRKLWDNSSDPFWVCKPTAHDFEVVAANSAALRLEPRQVPGATFRQILGHGPDADRMIDGYRACVNKGEATVLVQEPMLEGKKRLFEAILVPIKDEQDEVTHVWGTAKDLTRFVVSENALRELNEQLEEMVSDRTAELNAAMEKLSELSLTDSLTGLANRRRFDEVLGQEFARLKRNAGALSLILLDIDDFKPFNDTYGHLAGDECLQRVARFISDILQRPTDLAARYGGEEFAIILPETDHEGARRIAEQLRDGIENLAIAHQRSTASDCITASLGAVTSDFASMESPEELIAKADARLYQAKAAGRNRVVADKRAPAHADDYGRRPPGA